jgi:pimeloyl-ACP methyl ester carboxylesterase
VLARHTVLKKHHLDLGSFVIPFATSGDGPLCLVCVNGMQQTMAAWRPFLKRFAADPRYRLALFDFPNQGRAQTRSASIGVDLLEQVAVLHAVAQMVGAEAPVTLIGGSWGGVVAAAYAATHPSRVAAMILGSFRTRSNARLCDLARRGQALVTRGDGEALGALFVEGFGRHMSASGQQRLRAQFRRLTPAQLRQMYQQGQALLDFGDIGRLVDLSAIRARTLIVNGADDPIVDAGDAYEAARRIPHAEVRLLEGVGHFLHAEQPQIMDVFADFLALEAERVRPRAAREPFSNPSAYAGADPISTSVERCLAP